MIRITYLLQLLFIIAVVQPLSAQGNKEKKSKKTHIKIISEEDGKKTVIDTTFENAKESDIDNFLSNEGFKHATPPAPPAPPMPPSPPTPPSVDDDQSFNFDFEMPDLDEMISIDINRDDIRHAKEIIEKATKEVSKELEKTKITKEEIKQVLDKMNNELKKLYDDEEKQIKKEKHIIIKKKTGDNGEENNNNDTGFNFHTSTGTSVMTSSFAGNKNEPVFYMQSNTASDHPCQITSYSYRYETAPKHNAFQNIVKKVYEKIIN